MMVATSQSTNLTSGWRAEQQATVSDDEHKKRVLNWMKSAHIFFPFPKTSYTHARMDTGQNCSTKVEAFVMFH